MGKTRQDVRAFVNVADHRAIGDGITSADQGFFDAIDEARAAPSIGNIVYAPEGVYVLDQGILPVYSMLEYRGAGIGRTILRAQGATTGQLFQSPSTARSFRLADLTIDLNGTALVGLELLGAAHVVLERVEILNGRNVAGAWPVSFKTNKCENVWIRQCYFHDIYREAISFGAGTALAGGFLGYNRASTTHSSWLAVSGAVEGTDYFDRDNIVTEAGFNRITGVAGVAEGPFTSPTLGAKWQDVPAWERVQYYKHGQVVTAQGAAEIIAGQAVAFGETVWTFDAGFLPVRPTPRTASGFPFLIGTDGTVKYQGETPLAGGVWIAFDFHFRLGGS